MTTRKISDVILSLERDVKELKAAVTNQDFKLTLILQALKKTDGQSRDLMAEKKLADITQSNIKQAKPIMPGLKSGVVMGPQGLHNKTDEEEDFEFPEVNTVSTKSIGSEETVSEQNTIIGQRRTNRYNNDGSLDKAVPVRQKILYPDGKLVCLANVEIFDMETKTIFQKLRTNATGEWIASLKPGKYQVNILKPKALNKPEIKLSFGIDIPASSSGPLELPSPEN